jgi:hypothetical protein
MLRLQSSPCERTPLLGLHHGQSGTLVCVDYSECLTGPAALAIIELGEHVPIRYGDGFWQEVVVPSEYLKIGISKEKMSPQSINPVWKE